MSIHDAPTHDFDTPAPPRNPKEARAFMRAKCSADRLGAFASKKPIWRYSWVAKCWCPIGVQYPGGQRFYLSA